MSWFGWIFSSSDTDVNNLNELDKVEILCDRIENSSLLEDKRQSLVELRDLSENCKLEVGTRSLDIVLNILEEFSLDKDSVVISLDILANVLKCRNQFTSDENKNDTTPDYKLSDQFCEILLKRTRNIEILVKLIESTDFQVRWAVLKIFLIISKSQLPKFQSALAEIHFGVTRILGYLSEPREFIRNDSIILLMSLSMNNQTMQKVLSFENIFELLWAIINNEGMVDGGIVVHDCIIIMNNVLTHNDCTQNHFREAGLFGRVKIFFDSTIDSSVWSSNKTNCLISMLQLVRSLLDPLSESLHVKESQNVILTSHIFDNLLTFMSFVNIPEKARIELFSTISECIRSNEMMQRAFSSYTRSISDNKDDMKVILASLINPKNSQILKHAILYLFQNLIHSNITLVQRILSSLIPGHDEQSSTELGRAICVGFFDYDNTLTWISCSCLIHVIYNYPNAKIEFLKLYFVFEGEGEKETHSQPTSLLNRCLHLLQIASISLVSKIHLISFLIVWMFECPEVATEYLTQKQAISLPLSVLLMPHGSNDDLLHGMFSILVCTLLLSLPEQDVKKIKNDITVRCSMSELKNSISELTHHSAFIDCSKSPRPKYSVQIPFDYEFTTLVKRIEVSVELMQHESTKQKPTNLDLMLEIKQKDERIQSLELMCTHLQQISDDLKNSIPSAPTTPPSPSHEVNWQEMYHEINTDFQQLLNDYQKLLKVSEEQEEEIKLCRSKQDFVAIQETNLSDDTPFADNYIPTLYNPYDASIYYPPADSHQKYVTIDQPVFPSHCYNYYTNEENTNIPLP